jgi:hypothetical protein
MHQIGRCQTSSKLPLRLIICVLFAGLATAAEGKLGRETLRGITSIEVVVESPDSEAIRDGLTKDQIQTDVELRLRKAGVRVIGSDDPEATKAPFLAISANLLKGRSIDGYAYSCQVALFQGVMVLSNSTATLASTWSIEMTGIAGTNNMVMAVRNSIGDLVDKFLNAYLSVNPKK